MGHTGSFRDATKQTTGLFSKTAVVAADRAPNWDDNRSRVELSRLMMMGVCLEAGWTCDSLSIGVHYFRLLVA